MKILLFFRGLIKVSNPILIYRFDKINSFKNGILINKLNKNYF